jgi:poly(hydroxyalkanoate) depolymerase family esterase
MRSIAAVFLIVLCCSCGDGKDPAPERQTQKIDADGNVEDAASADTSGETSGESAVTTPVSAPSEATTSTRPDTVSWGEIGGRRYRLFVPGTIDSAGAPRPLVVMLHGCDQNAADFATLTGMDALARRDRFVVVYPEQSLAANLYRCWNWFSVTEQSRGGEEARFVVAAIDEAASQTKIDRAHVFAAGLSAGAAFAVVLGSCFPDRFLAVAAHSGLAFKAANTAGTAMWVMSGGPVYSADASAEGARLCAGMNTPATALALTGDADNVVNPGHSTRIYEQFRALADWSDDGGRNDSIAASQFDEVDDRGRSVQRTTTLLSNGRSVEHVWITGLGHAWSGGHAGFKYSDPAGPVASEIILRFFAAQP